MRPNYPNKDEDGNHLKRCMKCGLVMKWDEYCEHLGKGFTDDYKRRLRPKASVPKDRVVDSDSSRNSNNDIQIGMFND